MRFSFPLKSNGRIEIVELIGCAAQVFLATLFLWSAASKAQVPGPVNDACRSVFGQPVCRSGVPILVLAEWTLGAWLLSLRGRRSALRVTFLAITSLTILGFVAHSAGYRDPCGCFGRRTPETPRAMLFRNGLITIVITLALAAEHLRSRDRTHSPGGVS
ncbi:MAG: hypothetical protein IT439_07985 [Phycisphaerales bacterium]|nr:hypothetical protein [Phycisphaerales bacterium]